VPTEGPRQASQTSCTTAAYGPNTLRSAKQASSNSCDTPLLCYYMLHYAVSPIHRAPNNLGLPALRDLLVPCARVVSEVDVTAAGVKLQRQVYAGRTRADHSRHRENSVGDRIGKQASCHWMPEDKGQSGQVQGIVIRGADHLQGHHLPGPATDQ
jgi:hypothetical protein